MAENTKIVYGKNGPEDKLPAAVIDTSFFAAFLLATDDEQGYETSKEEIEYIVSNGGIIFVPTLFWYEIGNVLINASKRKKNGTDSRISVSDANDILYDLKQFPIVSEDQSDLEIIMRIKELAAEYNLSYYDASYLELSRRLDLPLLTFDEKLKASIK